MALRTVALTLVFPAQATLMPVCWHLHLVSQVGTLGYYFIINPLLGLSEPNIQHSMLRFVIVGFFYFWLCFICNLGVYLYERLQQSDFESRASLRSFLHAVSHDLRNPVLGTVMVMKNLLNQPGEKVQISRSMLERIIKVAIANSN